MESQFAIPCLHMLASERLPLQRVGVTRRPEGRTEVFVSIFSSCEVASRTSAKDGQVTSISGLSCIREL